MKRYELGQENQLKNGKVEVVFKDGTKSEMANVYEMVKEVNGKFIPTGEKSVMYSSSLTGSEFAYYLQ